MSAAALLAAIEAENTLDVIDTHTAGEPTRIVLETDALPALEGDTIFERHTCATKRWDAVRRRLVHEPRGHRDMVGAFVLPPTHAEGEIGVLFCDTKGFLTMCVHGSIAVSRVLMKMRRLQSLRLDTPAGVIEASAKPDDSGAEPVITVRNVLSFVSMIDRHVMLNGRDTVFDIAFGGNFAALVDVERVGLEISLDRISDLRSFGDALLKEINRTMLVQHPTQPEIQGVTLAYFYRASKRFSQVSNIVVFGNKQVDRSPCGTGTSAMLAALVSRGRLALGRSAGSIRHWVVSSWGTLATIRTYARVGTGSQLSIRSSAPAVTSPGSIA